MKRHAESHLDHGLTTPQIDFLFKLFADRSAFFIEEIEFPKELGTVPCGLWGPIMGDPPIHDGGEVLPLKPAEYLMPSTQVMMHSAQTIVDAAERFRVDPSKPFTLTGCIKLPTFTGAITLGKRGSRSWESRLIDLPLRPTRKVTVIAGPHEDEPCILYTAYGGPLAPQELADPGLNSSKLAEAIDFWSQHALSKYAS